MIVVLKKESTEKDIEELVKRIESLGLKALVSKGVERTIVGVIGDEMKVRAAPLDSLCGVEKVMPILQPFKLVSREMQQHDTVVSFSNGNQIGGKKLSIIAGPCSVETEEGLIAVAEKVKKSGAMFLRGGAFKPRTSPYSFQGLGKVGLDYLKEAKNKTGLLVVTELMDPRDLDMIVEYADVIQIGARNMQNFRLLTEVGKQKKPILLKRGISSTIKELLMSAEYIAAEGNTNIILCERGIRTFETATRNTMDLSAIPVLKKLSHLPVIVDPSHGVGIAEHVAPMALAAVAAGADGLLIEVHNDPSHALCDGNQSLTPEAFQELVEKIGKVAEAVGREI